jgi:hypothetical protein
MIWKQRSECVFHGVQPSISTLVLCIKEEAGLWERAGAKGLRAVLLTTWEYADVILYLNNSLYSEGCTLNSLFAMKRNAKKKFAFSRKKSW